jgi:NCAIR mutase (PurE)-related protein
MAHAERDPGARAAAHRIAIMTTDTILEMLQRVRDGGLRPEEAMERLANLPYEDAGFAKIDHHRPLRTGLPEVIYAGGKTAAQVAEIFFRMAAMGGDVLATRADEAAFAAVKTLVPEATYHPVARVISLASRAGRESDARGSLAVLCAGTSDLAVAEEAAVTAEVMGAQVRRIYDVGVAGLHRLLAHREVLREAEVVIVCAGMEGALPSVVGGLVGAPVIAVPTSVGYGASFGGIAALLGMLNSCSPNVTVVNIDNGFGAAYAASMILRRIHHHADKSTELASETRRS